MSNDTSIPGDNGTHAPAATGLDMDVLKNLITDTVNKAITGRLTRIEERIGKTEATIPGLVTATLEKLAETVPVTPGSEGAPNPTVGNDPGGAKSLKALREELQQQAREAEKKLRTEFEAKLKDSDQKRLDAEAKALDTRLQSEARSEFAKHFGADSPHIRPLMDSYHHVQKRFGYDESGRPVVKFQRDGYEETKPIADGCKELLETELKDYIKALTPSRNGHLPPSGLQGRGQPYRAPQPTDGQPGAPWLDEIGRAFETRAPNVAAALHQAAATPAVPNPNGTPSK